MSVMPADSTIRCPLSSAISGTLAFEGQLRKRYFISLTREL
jgi:hypothetical protein